METVKLGPSLDRSLVTQETSLKMGVRMSLGLGYCGSLLAGFEQDVGKGWFPSHSLCLVILEPVEEQVKQKNA